jgi:hypothetical protein
MNLRPTLNITAAWDDQFGAREKGTNAIFLMAGKQCLGYVNSSRGNYMACVGAGMGAPIVAMGRDLDECKRAVENYYGAISNRRA